MKCDSSNEFRQIDTWTILSGLDFVDLKERKGKNGCEIQAEQVTDGTAT